VDELLGSRDKSCLETPFLSLLADHHDILVYGFTPSIPVSFHISFLEAERCDFQISAASDIASTSWGPLNLTVELPIGHFNPQDDRAFQNRYWLNDTFYEPGGPIFLYDAGEAGIPVRGAQQLNSDQVVFAPVELAKKYSTTALLLYGSTASTVKAYHSL